MNIYVSPSNQKLLWKTITRSPLFTNKQGKDVWFKNIIGQFYENNKTNTTITLREINLHTINYMVKLLQEENKNTKNIVYPGTTGGTSAGVGASTPSPVTQYPPQNHFVSIPNQTPSYNPEIGGTGTTQSQQHPITQQDFMNARRNEFDTKLQEMEKQQRELLQTKAPQEIDFRDKVEDAPIANIGELMKMEIEKRNRDIQQFVYSRNGVPMPPPSSQTTSIQLPLPPAQEPEPVAAMAQKHVTWKEGMIENSNDMNTLLMNMEKMIAQIEKLTTEIDFLRTLLEKYPEIEKIYQQTYQKSLIIPEQESPMYDGVESSAENSPIEITTAPATEAETEPLNTVKEIVEFIESNIESSATSSMDASASAAAEEPVSSVQQQTSGKKRRKPSKK